MRAPFVGRPTPHTLAVVLAGGEGRRLWPLTSQRAKPAVPIGGRYRLIDFVLSSLVNSGLHRIKVLTQYKSDSLNSHIARGWRLPSMLNLYVEAVPAQQRLGKEWFRGSADAMWQSLNIITDESPDLVAIFSGDQMYKMDVGQMIEYHLDARADVTVAALPVPVDEAQAFGILEVSTDGELRSFVEKPAVPREIPGRPGWALASLGNYVFSTGALLRQLERVEQEGAYDFGRNILPSMVGRARCFVYDFATNDIPGEGRQTYWRDVGTIASYWRANMDLVEVTPPFNLYNPRWPVHTHVGASLPPAKFVFAEPGPTIGPGEPRMGISTDSLVCEGVIVSGGRTHRSVLGPGVRINSFAHVEECVLCEGVDIGRHARVRRAIIDKGVSVPPDMEIGYDLEEDARRFEVVDGIVVVEKGALVAERARRAAARREEREREAELEAEREEREEHPPVH